MIATTFPLAAGHENLRRAVLVALAGDHSMAILQSPTGPTSESILRRAPAGSVVIPRCPCGNLGTFGNACLCSLREIERHVAKWSGIAQLCTIWVDVNASYRVSDKKPSVDYFEEEKKRSLAVARWAHQMPTEWDAPALSLMVAVVERAHLSTVARIRMQSVANTIARLQHMRDERPAQHVPVSQAHVAEAAQYLPPAPFRHLSTDGGGMPDGAQKPAKRVAHAAALLREVVGVLDFAQVGAKDLKWRIEQFLEGGRLR